MILKKLRRIMKLVKMNGKNLWQIKRPSFKMVFLSMNMNIQIF